MTMTRTSGFPVVFPRASKQDTPMRATSMVVAVENCVSPPPISIPRFLQTDKQIRTARSSSREVRIRVPFFSVVYFNRGTNPPQKKGIRALGDLDMLTDPPIPRHSLVTILLFIVSKMHISGHANWEPGVVCCVQFLANLPLMVRSFPSGARSFAKRFHSCPNKKKSNPLKSD